MIRKPNKYRGGRAGGEQCAAVTYDEETLLGKDFINSLKTIEDRGIAGDYKNQGHKAQEMCFTPFVIHTVLVYPT